MTKDPVVPFKVLLRPSERVALRRAALDRGVPAAKLVRTAIARYTSVRSNAQATKSK